MKFYRIFLAGLICFYSAGLFAQSDAAPKSKKHHFVIYGGVGPNIYFNNLVLAHKYVGEINYSFAGRLMWEPEHNLSLGIESGYYRLYHIDFGDQSDVNITNSVIPIHLVVCMKFLKTFYFNFASGQSILKNKVTNYQYGDINTSAVSLGDFAGSVGYRKKIEDRLSLGTEIKFFYSSKLDDKNIALLFMLGFSL